MDEPRGITEGSARLRAIIKARGTGGQTKIAHEIGVTDSRISNWVRGSCMPRIHHALILQDKLGIALDCWMRLAAEDAK